MTKREERTVTFPLDTCAACGAQLSENLVRLRYVDCHDCRETQAPASDVRELAHRSGDGLDVTLVWYPARNRVSVRVADTRSGEHFELSVDPAAALDAFEHPFAYPLSPARETAGVHRSLATA